jgi:hypothetical protein
MNVIPATSEVIIYAGAVWSCILLYNIGRLIRNMVKLWRTT